MQITTSAARAGAVSVAALAFAGTACRPAPATVVPTRTLTESDAGAAAALSAQLGADSTGAYVDDDGTMAVAVTSSAAADRVRAAGAKARLVRHSAASLGAVTSALEQSARIPGTSWAVDPVSNQVVVTADSTVTDTKLDQLNGVAARFGDAVRVERHAGEITPVIAGGDLITSPRGSCSLGFSVTKNNTRYFLTAGHCGNIAKTWYGNPARTTVVGTTVSSTFPGNDYALVQYAGNANVTRGVDLYNGRFQSITTAANAVVGQSVSHSGITSHVRSGRVQALNVTVNYQQGSVRGLVRTSACAGPGDSGGPYYSGTTALGTASGGTASCLFGGQSFYQPILPALAAYGVTLY